MKHLVVLAHPRPDSFIRQVAGSYVDELELCGHSVTVRDLYAMGFNPVLASAELEDGAGPADDVRREQELIRDADVVTLVFPIWWSSMPAILKGYVDRVFSHGFALRMSNHGVEGGLTGRKGVLITSSGAPRDYLVQSGEMQAFKVTLDEAVLGLCGLIVVEHLHFGGMAPGVTAAQVDEHLARVRRLVRDHF